MPSVSASDRAIASPMRIDVKLPGPRPTTMPSIVAGSSTSSSTATSRSPARAARTRPPGASPQTAPKEVAVSKARIVFTRDLRAAMRLVDVTEGNGRARPREPGGPVLGPFHERDRAVEVGLEVAPRLGVDAVEAVEVEVRDGRRRLVAVPDRERRARDGAGDAERASRAADERRLPRPQLARDGHDVPGAKPARKIRPERLGLRRRCRHHLHAHMVAHEPRRLTRVGDESDT